MRERTDGGPGWLFAAPVRRSRFTVHEPAYAAYNIEVAPDLLAPFAFEAARAPPVLLYERQTQLHGNYRGRNGSGRAGIYEGRYVKGVGRTPAAENWGDGDDLYHASGHLSVASALRERLITRVLAERGLAALVVTCEAVLLGALSPAEMEAIGAGETSSKPVFAAADAHMIALSVKPADFARASNIVFALEQCAADPPDLGALFLDLEHHLHPPGEARTGLQGSPQAIALALEAAFERGLRNFESFARIGLFWLYFPSNYTLDGRFLDLETPLYLGKPFLGVAVREHEGRTSRRLLGFDEFVLARDWRLFLAWLRARLGLMAAPEMHAGVAVGRFAAALAREIGRVFGDGHLLYDDAALVARAVRECAANVGARGAAHVEDLARFAFVSTMYGRRGSIPDAGWRPLEREPAPPTPYPQRYEVPAFLDATPSSDAETFAADLARLGAIRDPLQLHRALTGP